MLRNILNSARKYGVTYNFFFLNLNIVLDVFSECYGPCKSMVPSLRKAKAETDVLQLAIVSS